MKKHSENVFFLACISLAKATSSNDDDPHQVEEKHTYQTKQKKIWSYLSYL